MGKFRSSQRRYLPIPGKKLHVETISWVCLFLFGYLVQPSGVGAIMHEVLRAHIRDAA